MHGLLCEGFEAEAEQHNQRAEYRQWFLSSFEGKKCTQWASRSLLEVVEVEQGRALLVWYHSSCAAAIATGMITKALDESDKTKAYVFIVKRRS